MKMLYRNECRERTIGEHHTGAPTKVDIDKKDRVCHSPLGSVFAGEKTEAGWLEIIG
jgi:hypothetical protein